jgi:predicted nucleic acid-binding protein
LIVVDTSAVVEALVAEPPDSSLIARLADDGDLHAPHLVDVEFLQVLRRLVAAGRLSPERADGARSDFGELAIVRYPHGGLLERVWELRHNLTAYDAVFVGLSELLGVPLVTCDAAMAEAPGHRAEVEVFPRS